MTRKPTRSLAAALVVLAVLTATAACGDDDTDETAPSDSGNGDEQPDGEFTPITVGILPIAGVGPVWYGLEQGYFEDEGLDVTLEIGQGGAQLAPSVLNDEYQFAVGEYLSLLQARESDVPLQVVSNLTDGADAADQAINALLVAPGSGIEGPEDLADQTIALNGLGGAEEVAVRKILDDRGVDSEGVEFVEIPFPDMNAAIETGEADVVAQVEPFITLGEQDGLVNLLDPFYEALPSMPLGLIFASEEWLADNAETAEAFNRALERAIEEAAADGEAMRDTIATNTEMEPELAQAIALDRWSAEIDRDRLATLAEMAVTYGALEEEPDLDALIWTPD